MKLHTYLFVLVAVLLATHMVDARGSGEDGDVTAGTYTLVDVQDKTYMVMDVDTNGYFTSELYYLNGQGQFVNSQMNIWGILVSFGFFAGNIDVLDSSTSFNGYMNFSTMTWNVQNNHGGSMVGIIHNGNLVNP